MNAGRDHAAIYRRRVQRAGGRLDRSPDDERRRRRTAARARAMVRMLADVRAYAQQQAVTANDVATEREWLMFVEWIRDRERHELAKVTGVDRRVGAPS